MEFDDESRVVEVVQHGEVRFGIFFHRKFPITLHCRETRRVSPRPGVEAPDPGSSLDASTFEFALAKPGMLKRFHGMWTIRPYSPSPAEMQQWHRETRTALPSDAAPANANPPPPPGHRGPAPTAAAGAHPRRDTWCRAELVQDVLPAGVHPGMARVPILRQVLFGASARALRRLAEDLRRIETRLFEGARLVDDVLRPAGWAAVPLLGPDHAQVPDVALHLEEDAETRARAAERARRVMAAAE